MLRKLNLLIDGKQYFNLSICFGVPNTNTELDEMYRLRYRKYREKNYIPELETEADIDQHDMSRKCRYVVAKIDGQIVGSVRLIVDDPLPTESYCFRFEEPPSMVNLARDRRAEVSRLVSGSKTKIPEHLIVVGMISCLHDLAVQEGILGGYLYVKRSLFRILEFIGIPIHVIENAKMIYDDDYMRGYFYDLHDPAIPAYYFRDEVGAALMLIMSDGWHGRIRKQWE
ncbi:MAG TPA: GNAT family N-acyltransferase [Candidatus Nitrosotenuis sp.]|nr:GNAT family N-acyltransferase [Candidatus Nitrosotenuis sp.]